MFVSHFNKKILCVQDLPSTVQPKGRQVRFHLLCVRDGGMLKVNCGPVKFVCGVTLNKVYVIGCVTQQYCSSVIK